MFEILQVRSEPYSSPSEIFVNGRDWCLQEGRYPVEAAHVGRAEPACSSKTESIRAHAVVEKLRMSVDIVGGFPTDF